MFLENSGKTESEEKRITGTIEKNQGKMHNIGKYGGGRVKGRKCAGGETWSGHAQQNFGRESAGQKWEIRERREIRRKEMQD